MALSAGGGGGSSGAAAGAGDVFVTEVPSSLKQLARLVVRGFYLIEDSLIIDMLVRNPCMKEDDLCELLKFERKMLRARIDTLKNDKFIQTKMKMETGLDGKAQRQNFYYINYKVFVNVVKYKLDHMRRKMETEERNATSRASFKCLSCEKTYTDLQADQLFDPVSGEFACTFCGSCVEEDASAVPRHDSRMLMAKFNDVMEPLFILLKEVEGVKLAPELLEPEPLDISDILNRGDKRLLAGKRTTSLWSGEATRNTQDTTINVFVNSETDEAANAARAAAVKQRPVWMTESTVVTSGDQFLNHTGDASHSNSIEGAGVANANAVSTGLHHQLDSGGRATPLLLPDTAVSSQLLDVAAGGSGAAVAAIAGGCVGQPAAVSDTSAATPAADDIMAVLLQHEKRTAEPRRSVLGTGSAAAAANVTIFDSDTAMASSSIADTITSDGDVAASDIINGSNMEEDDEDDDDYDDGAMLTVMAAGEPVPINNVTPEVIERMTCDEKEQYILTYQEHYGDMHE